MRPRSCSFLAMARHHRLCSSLMSLMMELTEGGTPSNTQAFLCFHIIQAPKIIREFTPLLYSFFTFFITLCHHSAKLCSHWLGMQSPRLRGDRRLNYTCLAITHDTNKCWAVSSSWSHRGHRSGWGSPLLSSLSAVQHLLRIANQRKTLHLFGAQDFQSLFQGSKVTDPYK